MKKNLSRYFWTEAVNTACYILNHVSTRPIIKKTPYEIWNERKSNIYYFYVFGCKCFILNNEKDNLGKFDAKSDEAIFLGYSSNSKAYRVFNKKTLTVEESIHVTFNEDILLLPGKQECVDNDRIIIEKEIKDLSLQDKPSLEVEELVSKNHNDIPKEWKYVGSHPKDLILGDLVRKKIPFKDLHWACYTSREWSCIIKTF